MRHKTLIIVIVIVTSKLERECASHLPRLDYEAEDEDDAPATAFSPCNSSAGGVRVFR